MEANFDTSLESIISHFNLYEYNENISLVENVFNLTKNVYENYINDENWSESIILILVNKILNCFKYIREEYYMARKNEAIEELLPSFGEIRLAMETAVLEGSDIVFEKNDKIQLELLNFILLILTAHLVIFEYICSKMEICEDKTTYSKSSINTMEKILNVLLSYRNFTGPYGDEISKFFQELNVY